MQTLLLDTMIFIECHRTRCWNGLAGTFQLETVETCCREALAGDKLRAGYVEVSQQSIDDGVHTIHEVTGAQRVNFALAYDSADSLDAGERDLFAHLCARKDNWTACCSDKAALRAVHALGWIDKFASLEALIQITGVRPNPPLHDQYTQRWLSETRTRLLLGVN